MARVCCLCLLLPLASVMRAQTVTGSVVGAVEEAASDRDGAFSLNAFQPGFYKLMGDVNYYYSPRVSVNRRYSRWHRHHHVLRAGALPRLPGTCFKGRPMAELQGPRRKQESASNLLQVLSQ